MKYMLTRRQFGNLSLLASGIPFLSGCGNKKKSSFFKVGVLAPKTGSSIQVGLSCERAVNVASKLFENVNIDLVCADTESRVDVSRTKAEKLINDGCHILIGAHDSSITTTIAQVCERRKVPMIINIAASNSITEQGYKYVFRNFPKASELSYNGISLIKELIEYKGEPVKKATLMHVNDTYGESMLESIKLIEKDLPFSISKIISYDANSPSLYSEISKAKEDNADLLICISRLNDSILIIKESIKQKYQPKAFISPGSPGMYENQFYKILGKYSNYCITNTAWYNPNSTLFKKAFDIFKQMYPNDLFELNVVFTIEAILIAIEAYKKAKSNNAEDLRNAISQTYIEDRIAHGDPIKFDHKGQSLGIKSVSLQNFDGKPKIIFPKELKEIEPVFPMPAFHQC